MSAPMTDERLAEIRARNAARTPGHWVAMGEADAYNMNAYFVVSEDNIEQVHSDDWGMSPIVCSTLQQTPTVINQLLPELARKADAEFIAHAPDDIAALLDEVERLRAELAETTSCHRCGTHKMRGATADYPELCKACGEYMLAKFGKPRMVSNE